MAYTMKGSPMQRNFGIGSPVKQKKTKEEMSNKEIKEAVARQNEKLKITDELRYNKNKSLIPPQILNDAQKTAVDSANIMNEELFRRGYSWNKKGKLVEPK